MVASSYDSNTGLFAKNGSNTGINKVAGLAQISDAELVQRTSMLNEKQDEYQCSSEG